MKKFIFTLLFILMCVTAVSASEYTVEKNLLYGLPPENVTISMGEISSDPTVTTEVLYDGQFDSITGNDATRWLIKDSGTGAELNIDFGKVTEIGRIMVMSGYSDVTTLPTRIWNSFKIEYFDGENWILLYEVSGNTERILSIDIDPITTRKLKFTSTNPDTLILRELVILPPGEDMYGKADMGGRANVLLNGKKVEFYKDKEVFVDEAGVVLVPVRMAEQLGADVKWIDSEASAVIEKDGISVTFKINEDFCTTGDGQRIEFGTNVQINQSRVYVPVRVLAESLGYNVRWKDENSTVIITSYEYEHMLNAHSVQYTPYSMYIDGVKQDIFTTETCDFVNMEAEGEVLVEAYANEKIESIDIRPLNSGVKAEISDDGTHVTFKAKPGQYLSIEFNKNIDRTFMLFINEKIEVPDLSDPNVMYFEGGKIYDTDIIQLEDNAVVYLGLNAVINGSFQAYDKKNIKILGNGIINSSYLSDEAAYSGTTAVRSNCTRFHKCENVEVRGPVTLGYNKWTNYLIDAENIKYSDMKILCYDLYSDGIDVVGSKDVMIDHVFIRGFDDSVVLKTSKYNLGSNRVENVSVKNSIFWASGNAMEIGYELDGDYVKNITFKNNDVIHKPTRENKFYRGAMTIHHAGNALISDILYEDIRIEDCEEDMIYIGFFNMPNWGKGGGAIENVTFKNITYSGDNNAPSELYSMIYNSINRLDNVKFINLNYGGTIIDSKKKAVECGFIIDDRVDVEFIKE